MFCNRKRRLNSSVRLQNVCLILTNQSLHRLHVYSTTSLDKSDEYDFQDSKENKMYNEDLKTVDYDKKFQKNQIIEHNVSLSVFYDTNGDSVAVTPEGIALIMRDALENNDNETIYLVIAEAKRIGILNSSILETSIKQCIDGKDLENASILLQVAFDRDFDISLETSQKLLNETITQCRWHLGAVSAGYMIKKGYPLKEKAIYHITGGLMKNAESIVEALKLVTLINDHKRGDLSVNFGFNKVILK